MYSFVTNSIPLCVHADTTLRFISGTFIMVYINKVSSTSTSMALVPYIKPSKFHPLSDSTWSESASRTTTTAGDDSRILPLWSGDPRGVRVTTWKRVEPPKDSVVVVDDLTVVADTKERLLNLKKNFKDTIEGLEPGFLYNELRRKIESSLDEGETGE